MTSRLHELAEGVYAWCADSPGSARPNAGLVVDADGLTLIDTLTTASQWEPLADAIDDLGQPLRRVVLTSSHVTYVGGTGRFWTAARYGRPQTSALLDQPPNLEGWRLLFPDLASDFTDDFTTRPVTHVVDEAAWLTSRVLAIPVTGQQLENLVVQVPDAGVLFAGAMCTFGVTPNAFDGDPEAWAEQLTAIADWGQTIVPGIGPLGGPDDVVALQAYLWACAEADGDPLAIPPGPWDSWTERDLDVVNVERAAMLARGDRGVPPSMLARLGLA
jgi:cyclase